jgi:hypothetical protein
MSVGGGYPGGAPYMGGPSPGMPMMAGSFSTTTGDGPFVNPVNSYFITLKCTTHCTHTYMYVCTYVCVMLCYAVVNLYIRMFNFISKYEHDEISNGV